MLGEGCDRHLAPSAGRTEVPGRCAADLSGTSFIGTFLSPADEAEEPSTWSVEFKGREPVSCVSLRRLRFPSAGSPVQHFANVADSGGGLLHVTRRQPARAAGKRLQLPDGLRSGQEGVAVFLRDLLEPVGQTQDLALDALLPAAFDLHAHAIPREQVVPGLGQRDHQQPQLVTARRLLLRQMVQVAERLAQTGVTCQDRLWTSMPMHTRVPLARRSSRRVYCLIVRFFPVGFLDTRTAQHERSV